MLFSRSPEANSSLSGLGDEVYIAKDPDYNAKLKSLSLFMSEVLKAQDARNELFVFARIEVKQNEIEYNLTKLFDIGHDPLRRRKSAIV